ncbi:MAG: tetratricopeptide repeat protein [Phycisphaerae bacterium]
MKQLSSVFAWIALLLSVPWLSLAPAETTSAEPVAADQPVSLDTIWQEAAGLEAEGKLEEAAAKYDAIPATSPDWQRAAVQAGTCLEKAGKLAEAVARYDAAIAGNPAGYWAETATFQKARALKAQGNGAEAKQCIERIKARFPDSSSFADALLLEAQIDARDTAKAEALVAKETAATNLYKAALQADRNKDEAGARQLLDAVILRYPGTPAALRCRDARAHILTRDKRPEARTEAAAEFLHILALVADSAPNSRIAETARLRLAALHHSFKNRQDAIAAYQGLLNSEDRAVASRAALQLAGLRFELLQREKIAAPPPADSRWDDLRALCTLVAVSKDAKPIERARAELMVVESFSWQDRPAEALAAAEAFLAKYEGAEFRQDVATAHFFAGEAAQRTKQYDKALSHFRPIIEAYGGRGEIWPGVDLVARTYFRVWETLRWTRAPAEELAKAADALLTTFPGSGYSKHVQIETEQDARKAEIAAKIRTRLQQAGLKE